MLTREERQEIRVALLSSNLKWCPELSDIPEICRLLGQDVPDSADTSSLITLSLDYMGYMVEQAICSIEKYAKSVPGGYYKKGFK